VKGYDFVSAEWNARKDFPAWLAANGARFRGDRPFFCFQHSPIGGTTIDGDETPDATQKALAAFPNAVAFTGHTHRPFVDERSLWQGEFLAMAVPSLSYPCYPGGHENAGDDRTGKARKTMPIIPGRRDLAGGQGYVVSVHADRILIERVDLAEGGVESAPAWLVPWPPKGDRPLDRKRRASRSLAPVFPADARLHVETRNTENRVGHWTIVMDCTFPAAIPEPGARVFDYEICAVPKDGSKPLCKRFLSPAYARLEKYEPAEMRFWFDVAELPQNREYVLEVRARNCFGKSSVPLVSGVWKSVPGFGTKDESIRNDKE